MQETIEYLEDAIEILVLMQYGLIPFECSSCNDAQAESLRCGQTVGADDNVDSVWYSRHTSKEYYSCPISMVPSIIFQWYDQYMFIQEFNTPQYPESTPMLFWWFVRTYKRIVNNIETKIHKDKQKELDKNTKNSRT